ncbi:MAG: ATP-binding cassette domain-containing protein [Saprospiraceae bacterium]|nr:ATP-binding cassette domain-containing protein [Saprospiraceae bacterium]
MSNNKFNQVSLTPFQRFLRLLHEDRKEIGYIYVYAIFAGLINLSLPLGIQAILNIIQGGAVSSSWWLLIVGVTLGTLFAGILIVMQMTVSETLQRRLFTRVSFDFAKRLPNLHIEAARGEYLPEVVNRFFDTLTLQKGLPKLLIDLSTAVMQIIFGLLLLSFYHPLFIFFGLVLLVLLIIIFRLTGPQGLKTSLKESKYKYEVAYWLEEVARTLQTFKLAGKSELPLSKTDTYVSNYLDAKRSHFRILLLQFGSIVAFKTLITFVLLTLGGWLVINNEINVGQFVAAEIIIILTLSSVEKMIVTMDTVYDVLTAIEKIGMVTDLPVETERGIDFDEVNTDKGIKLDIENLTYHFENPDEPILRGINLNIESGERVCIAGYNGSGKTTLVQVISCFLSDYKGVLSYNGVPRNNFNQISLRNAIGDYSAQEDIFKGTLRENITLGYTHIKFDELVKVCEAVGLMRFINLLPKGFDTPLLPAGKTLPRSIVSKIILARGILNKPQLLAIEELMANLEYTDRLRIANLLTDKSQNWTLIAVTDDPVLASRCDRVIVMKEGQIIEQGTFDDIQKSVHYNRIFKTHKI